ncbi:protein YkpC [Metabacillus kandeliae]
MKDIGRRILISLLLTGIIGGGITVSMANLPGSGGAAAGK